MWHFEEVAGSFGEAFLADPHGPRVLALEVPRGYRDAPAEEREVAFVRHVACAPCAKKGCELCSFAGWTVGEGTMKVVVPHGATPGTRLTAEGASDRAPGVPPRPAIVVEVVEPGPRADELRAAERDYEGKLTTAWQMDRTARHRGRRHAQLAVAVAIALGLSFAIGHWLAKPATGEACTMDDDCRSGRCLRLLTVTLEPVPRLDGRMCTSSCATDLDCPSSMHCTENVDPTTKRQYALDAPPGRACIPNGY